MERCLPAHCWASLCSWNGPRDGNTLAGVPGPVATSTFDGPEIFDRMNMMNDDMMTFFQL